MFFSSCRKIASSRQHVQRITSRMWVDLVNTMYIYIWKSTCVSNLLPDLFSTSQAARCLQDQAQGSGFRGGLDVARLSRLHKNWNEEPLVVEALHRVIRLFGVQRSMFASNAPVDQQDGWPPSRAFRVTFAGFQGFFCMLLGCVMAGLGNSLQNEAPST